VYAVEFGKDQGKAEKQGTDLEVFFLKHWVNPRTWRSQGQILDRYKSSV